MFNVPQHLHNKSLLLFKSFYCSSALRFNVVPDSLSVCYSTLMRWDVRMKTATWMCKHGLEALRSFQVKPAGFKASWDSSWGVKDVPELQIWSWQWTRPSERTNNITGNSNTFLKYLLWQVVIWPSARRWQHHQYSVMSDQHIKCIIRVWFTDYSQWFISAGCCHGDQPIPVWVPHGHY